VGDEVGVSQTQLALILEALDDAAYYRETRSRVLDSSVKRAARHGVPAESGGGADAHRLKAQAYRGLAADLEAKASQTKGPA